MSVLSTGAAPSGIPGELRCGDLFIDRRARRIRNLQGEPQSLGSRAFDLLLALIDGGGEPLHADTLRAKVWRGREMAANNLRVQITQLRRLIGRDAVLYRPGEGYQLLFPVEPLHAAPAEAAEPAEPPPAPPGNLPESLWDLLGREVLVQRLDAALAAGARLSLVGPAGVGKTTLALAGAQRTAARFAGGAWWVELAPLRDPLQLAQTVAAALQLPGARDHGLEQLVSALSDRRLMLVLDNCEHLRAAVAELADRLLRGAPGVTLLASSRVALGHAGECVLAVPELSLPAAGGAPDWAAARASGAVAVFASRACAADPRFRLTPENAPLVVDICRRLDGNALAITLAAAQVPVLGLLRLRERLDERLRWTHRHGGDAAAHQLSLQATLDWSCELLLAHARRLLQRLGAFAGHFGFDAVSTLAATDPALAPAALDDALHALVAHGLVTIDSISLLGQDAAAEAGYTMHESVRLYARQRLQAEGEFDAAHGALARWLLQRLRSDSGRLRGEFASPALVQRLISDLPPAVSWAAAHDPRLGAALVHTCSLSWRRLGLHALLQRLCALLMPRAVAGGHDDARLDLLFSLMGVDFELERHAQVIAHADTALALLAGRAPSARQALALSWKANVLTYSQGVATAEPLTRQAMALNRDCGDAFGIRQSLNNLGWTLQQLGRFEEAGALNLRDGDDWDLMVSHENLGELELAMGRHAEAVCHFEREAALARRLPDAYRLALAPLCLVQARLGARGTTVPVEALREALAIGLKQAFPRVQSDAASVLALLLSRRGQHRLAVSTLGFADALRRRCTLSPPDAARQAEAEVHAHSGTALTAQENHALRAQGAVLGVQDLIDRVEALGSA